MKGSTDLILQELGNENKVILLSIKPRYSELIFRGEKTIELRKVFPAHYVGYVLVYESRPAKKITGILKIEEIHVKNVRELMKLADEAKVTRTFIRKYFSKKSTGFVIEIGEKFEFTKKIPLRELKEKIDFVPPQNFRYIEKDEISWLFREGCGGRRTYRRGIFSKERILNFFKHKIRRQ